MHNSFTLFLCFSLTALFSPTLSAQQVVWPGDANNNGIVNGADLVFWSQAYGATGPERPQGNNQAWGGQPAAAPWEFSFPTGPNFSFADANGDGTVNGRDLQTLLKNQHLTHGGPPRDDAYQLPYAEPDYEAVLSLEAAGTQLTPEGTELLLDLRLAGREEAFAHFYAMSFRATLTDSLFQPLRTRSAQALVSSLDDNPYGLVRWITLDTATAQLEVTLVAIDATDRTIDQPLERIALPFLEDVDPADFPAIGITIDSLVVVDRDFVLRKITTEDFLLSQRTDCSFTVDPVCGADGLTYLNGCFAEAAGVSVYTQGACWHPGLVAENMNPTPDCPTAYEPVCGFNGVTYANACSAEAAGVTAFVSGVCGPNDLNCYDPGLIVVSSGTTVNQATGVISLDCPDGDGPVCGCDGEQYPSACAAEAAGVRSYTAGTCDDVCVDPTRITETDDCEDTPAFVCGCNGETYVNACFAEAAGVQTYTVGPCSGSAGWCEEATAISCGEYLPNESTIGAGNQLSVYPGGSGVEQLGPDRVYTFQKTSAGDLQVGLEIMTPGLDMNLFLLTGDCNDFRVVGASTTGNTRTNNEGIVLEDAPNGTYYIVVDAPEAGPGGNYRLELSCGYLDCSERVPLTCGQTYQGTNEGGNDDVSTYTCGRTLNVENNGPEVVHAFTTTAAGPVTIRLDGLAADLELFLVADCDRGACLQYSQNPGTTAEEITRELPAGTYLVVVDGYNGAVSDYTLTVDCPAACDLAVTTLGQTDSDCGETGGGIDILVSGGSPTYTAQYDGPVSRTITSPTGRFEFTDLPPGAYTGKIVDRNGCELSYDFTIGTSGDGLTGTLEVTDAGCGQDGALTVRLDAGVAPYRIFLSGDQSASFLSTSGSFVLSPLAAGTYTVSVVDAGGCRFTETATIGSTGGGLDVRLFSEPADCDDEDGQIVVRTNGSGTLPYTIRLRGPVSGGRVVSGFNFRIHDLRAGRYVLSLTDAVGCTFEGEVTVGNSELSVQVVPTAAECSSPGAVRVTVTEGDGPYTITYTGPVSAVISTEATVTDIPGLPSGTYSFFVEGDDDCEVAETVFIEDAGGRLELSVTQAVPACAGNDSELQLSLTGGSPSYSIVYTGTRNGSVAVDGTGSGRVSLPPGNYAFTATDFNGCTASSEFVVRGGLSPTDQQSWAFANACGQLDNLRTALSGGDAPYTVVISDPCGDRDTSFVTNDNIFDLRDLPNCTYTVSVTDAGGCQSTDAVVIDVDPAADILQLTARNGACGGNGRIDLEVTAGNLPYFISWTGPRNGNVDLGDIDYSVLDLPAGTYTFRLTNREGCEDVQSITLLNDGDLSVASRIVSDDCGAPARIQNNIDGGVAPYTVDIVRRCGELTVPVFVAVSGNYFEILDSEPCCYDITVTDVNGCQTVSTVCVDPNPLFTALPTDGLCAQPGGIDVRVVRPGVAGPYRIDYSGPTSGTRTSNDEQEALANLPPGTYTVTLTDRNGCTEARTVVVGETLSDLALQSTVIRDDCGQLNQLWNEIGGGTAPYAVRVTRLCDNTEAAAFTQDEPNFALTELTTCAYRVRVTDANGCRVTTTTDVAGGTPELFAATPVPGPCGQAGRIDLAFSQGQPPYALSYTGPQAGTNTVNGNALSLADLPPGNYSLTVTDANGCRETEALTLLSTDNDLVVDATLVGNACGSEDAIGIAISNGSGPYAVRVLRQCDGTVHTEFVSESTHFELTDLPPCAYRVIVTDAAGCSRAESITVQPAPPALFELVTASGACNALGSLTVRLTGGRAPYHVRYTGPRSGEATTGNSALFWDELPSGAYTLEVTDDLGCQGTENFTITNTTSDLDLVTALIDNDCGQRNNLRNEIRGGTPPFRVEVTRRCDGATDTTFTLSSRVFDLPDRQSCEYHVELTDATGCADSESIRVGSTSANLFNLLENNNCDSTGFQLDFIAGAPPYRVVLNGPISREFTDVTGRLFIPAPAGDYSLRVWSANGCSEMNFTALRGGEGGQVPSVSFSTAITDLSVSFGNTSSPGNSFWTFGDGTTSTLDNPRHTYATTGTYNVCLRVTNNCGGNESCRAVTVSGSSSNLLGHLSSLALTMNGDEVENATYELSEPNASYLTTLPRNAEGIPSTLAGLNLGRMYFVQPVRNADPRNGLSSFEVFLGQRWLLGYEVPEITNPLQIVAADINCSQSFTNLDLLIMQKLLTDEIDAVPGCNSWTFVPQTYRFPENWNRYNVFPVPRRAEIILQHDTLVMFTGLKTGDLLFDADPGRSAPALPLGVAVPERLGDGSVHTLTVTLPTAGSLVSLEGILRAAPGLEIVAVTAGRDLPELAIGEQHRRRGELFLSWYSPSGTSRALNAGAGLVEVAVRATSAYRASSRPPLTFATGDPRLASAAHDGNWRRLLPRIEGVAPSGPAFRLYPAAPNPTAEFTTLRFELPAAATTTLTVFDGLGRPVIRREQALESGPQRFRLDLRALPGGVYTYRLRAGEHGGTGKLVRE